MRSCLHFCTSDSWGGLELYSCTLMAELKQAGWAVTAACRPGSNVERFLHEREIPTIHLAGSVGPSSILALKKILRQKSVDVLHVHFHKDIWPASLSLLGDGSRKLFLSIYMGVSNKTDPLHRFIYKRVDGIFTSSEELVRKLGRVYPVPASKIHYLPYGRDLRQRNPDDSKRERIRSLYGVSPDEILVGTMVRIDPGKGAMDFARGYSYIDPELRGKTKFLIVGEPTRKGRVKPDESPFEPRCEAYLQDIEAFIAAEGFSQKILLAGFQPDLAGYLSAMDVFVFPSRNELYSLVVLDAMAAGLPVVASRAGGNLRQIEEGKNGLLYNVADSRDAAQKISTYVASGDLRRLHGAAARSFVEHEHDMRQSLSRLLGFYER